jgi:uncharacterized protein YegJ (DUF2314 family)
MKLLRPALLTCMLAMSLLPLTSAMAKKPHASAVRASAPASTPASASAKASSPSKGDETVSINDADPAMQAAFKKAQATLDDFLAVVNSKNPKIKNMAVKIAIKEGKQKDYLWILPFTQTPNGFQGELNSEPQVVKNLAVGQQVIFTRGIIVDWMYVNTEDRTMHGNFTTCALLTTAPPAEIKEMKNKFGLDCSKP